VSGAQLTSRDAVLAAIAEFDHLGRENFLSKYGFSESLAYHLVHDGNRYDSKAIVGAAFGYEHADEGPLLPNQFDGGRAGAAAVLKRLGFTVEVDLTPGQISRAFRQMKVATIDGHPAPHKPLLLMIALRRFREGLPRLVTPQDVAAELQPLLQAALPATASPSPWEPIWRMEPPIWEVVGSDRTSLRPNGTAFGDPPLPMLRAPGTMCGFTQDVIDTLTAHPQHVAVLEQQLVAQMPGVPADVIETARGGAPTTKDTLMTTRLVAVHVGQRSVPNFNHSLPDGIWGWKTRQPYYDDITPGDLIVFGIDYTGGSPRTGSDEFAQHSYRRVVIGRVTSPVTEATEPYWPDEAAGLVYPHRITFHVMEYRPGASVADLNAEFDVDVGEALRLSAISQMRGVIVELPNTPAINGASADTRTLADAVNAFADALRVAGLDYGPIRHHELTRSFIASLVTKRFVILTGLSGSGKTQIAKQFGTWLGPGRLKIVAVRPDWTNPDALLGYENGLSPLKDGGYAWHVPEALEVMLAAARDAENPYLLVLDEMNLAHVERYFADVLSGMESKHPVVPNLAPTPAGWRLTDPDRPKLPFPDNLFIVGTVNVDETTYMFSPKVLDRANTIEFRVMTTDLAAAPIPPSDVVTGDPALVSLFLRSARSAAAPRPESTLISNWLRELHEKLSASGREFGHRTFAEALRFADLLAAAGEPDPMVSLDVQVLQKILPKVHGSIREVGDTLNTLGAWCAAGPGQPMAPSFDAAAAPPSGVALPRSFDKIHRMAKRLRANHFVSFAE
jgi:hypothetical protein